MVLKKSTPLTIVATAGDGAIMACSESMMPLVSGTGFIVDGACTVSTDASGCTADVYFCNKSERPCNFGKYI